MKKCVLVLLLGVLFISSCKEEDDGEQETPAPIVFVHGLLASGDTYANTVMRFTSNDFPADRLFAFDYNSLNYISAQQLDTAGLDDFIDDVLQKTGASRVNLVGHSLGGTTGYAYLSDHAKAAKVAHYAHVASGAQTTAAGPNADVPTINIYSTADSVTAGADIPGATNVALSGKDHYEVATCEETFEALYKFFNNGKVPATLQITSQSSVKISGKVVSLGENEPKVNATVKVFEVNPNSGERISGTPAFTLSINSKGEWGPHDVSPGKYYEFEVNPNEATDRIVHYYYEGFIHDNPLVYLRLLPPPAGTAGLLVNSLPRDDNQAVVVLFTANQAAIYDRDSLSVEGNLLSTQEFCDGADNTIAFFIYDDGDSQTEINFNPPTLFSAFPFLEGADIFFPTATPQSIQCRFNGRNLFARNWKSNTEGVSIVVFN